MRIEGIIWLRDVEDKLALKHKVDTHEVEEALILSARDMARKERRLYGKD